MKKFLILLSIFILVLTLGACSNKNNKKQTFILDSIEVTKNPTKIEYTEGETFNPAGIEVIATYKAGKKTKTENVTSKVTYDKTVLALGDTSVTVTYTEGDIIKTATITITVNPLKELIGDGLKLSKPESELVIEVDSPKGKAKSYWFTSYKDDGLHIKAIVEDPSIDQGTNTFNADGIEVLVSKIQRIDNIAPGTLRINASVRKDLVVAKHDGTQYVNQTTHSITSKFDKVSFGGKYVEGYQIELVIPYAALDVTKEDKNITFVPALYNNQGTIASIGIADLFDVNLEYSRTFIHIVDDDTYAENPWVQLGAVFGNYKQLEYQPGWDLTHDDGTEDAYIEMNYITPGTDNNIYMHRSGQTEFYAYVKVSAKQVFNNEKYGKFGITITTEDGKDGLFFFIDAKGDGTNMTGINVATVNRENGSWKWPEKVLTSLPSADSYQNGNFVELAVYRYGSIFEFYVNGQSVGVRSGFSGLTETSKGVVGLASFNITFIAKEYGILTEADDLEPYRFDTEEIDYLFIGDDYIDTAFWTGFNHDFKTSAVNLGERGTKVAYWLDQIATIASLYNPKNLIIHIGVNDINDGLSGSETLSNVTNLIERLHDILPDTQIYFISIEPNNYRPNNFTEYQVVNNGILTLANEKDYVHYIDTVTILGGQAGEAVKHYFGPDGLHLNPDGYGVWVHAIKKALGLEVIEAQDNLGNYGIYARSYGWSYEDGYVENTGSSEQQIYFDGVRGTHFAVSVDINVRSIYNGDNYPKVGIALKSSDKTVFFFIDAIGNLTNKWGNYVVRPSGGDWDWGTTNSRQYVYLGDVNYNGESYKTLSVVRLGTTLYFISDGKVVQYAENVFAEDEITQASVLLFNLQVRLKNAEVYLDEELEDYMATYKIAEKSGPVIDGNLDDWDEAILARPFVIPSNNGRYANVYAFMAPDGLYIAYVARHQNPVINNKPEWFNNTNVEFRLGKSGEQRFASANGFVSRYESWGQEHVGTAKYTTKIVDSLHETTFELFIPWAMIDGYSYDSPYIEAGFAWKNPGEERTIWGGGDFWFVPESDPGMRYQYITKTGFIEANELDIDGDISDWDPELDKLTLSQNGNTFDIQFVLGDDGVYGYYKADLTSGLNLYTNNFDEWWINPNIEFWVNMDKHVRIMIFDGKLAPTGRVTEAAFTYDNENHVLVIEFFIHYNSLGLTEKPTSATVRFGSPMYNGFWMIGNPDINITFNDNGFSLGE